MSQEEIRDLAALASVISATVQSYEPAEVMRTGLQRLVEVLHMDIGVIHLRDGEDLILGSGVNLSRLTIQELQRFPLSEDRFTVRCLLENRALIFDPSATDHYPDSASGLAREGLKSVAAVPIPSPLGPVGVLVVGSAGAVTLSQDHLVLLQAVTNQVGVALEHARLVDRLERLVEERTEQLEQAQEQLVMRERLATLGQLAGSLGHELRGPLVNLQMALNLLETADPEMRSELIARMARELSRCHSVINDLLDYTRSKEPHRVSTGLPAILHQAARTLAGEPGVELSLDLGEVERIDVDADQVLRLFENLLLNASQAVGGQGRVRVSLREKGAWLEVRVEDSGPGVPGSMRERIFEPLVTTRRGGTGLGLAVCRRTVDAHGGSIHVEQSSQLGGAAFVVRLPRGLVGSVA
ncbi:sensor histidine kinase [bacterium CPR1]|nr:sensor histidine kinase [bacterium CPR1]